MKRAKEDSSNPGKRPRSALYLDTINRKALDFDEEKVCSVSLSDANVYACLVCGRFLKGRSSGSECFAHALNEDHHVFMNLDTYRFYVLPENYPLDESATQSLEDIQLLANPTYTASQVSSLDKTPLTALDLTKTEYTPGFVGLVNFGASGYINVVIQALGHVSKFRDPLLLDDFDSHQLARRLSSLVRKMWSSHLFKPHVSPKELVAYIDRESQKRFTLQRRSTPRDLLLWLLTHFETSLTKKVFQGKLEQTKFWLLTLDLPDITLFRDSVSLEVPQVKLDELLAKKQYKFKRLPKVLVIAINRLDSEHKLEGIANSDLNQTIVQFDPDLLDVAGHKYRLVANVVLTATDRTASNSSEQLSYNVQLLDKARQRWQKFHDLTQRTVEKELLFLEPSCLQFWEAR